MAKYDVVQKVDGNTTIVSTWVDNKAGARAAFHERVALLTKDASVSEDSFVAVFDENLDVLEGLKVKIDKSL